MSITTIARSNGGVMTELAPEVLAGMTREAKRVWSRLRGESRMPDLNHSTFGHGAFVKASIRAAIKEATHRKTHQEVKDLLKFILSTRVLIIDGEQVFVPSVFEVRMPDEKSTASAAQYVREPDGIDWRAERLTPEEAGETRVPEPVIIRAPKKAKEDPMSPVPKPNDLDLSSMKRVIFSEDTVRALRYLGAYGVVEDDKGAATAILADRSGAVGDVRPNTVMTSLRDHGAIEVDTRATKTYRIAITPRGRHILAYIDNFRSSEVLLLEWLARQGGVYANPENPSRTTTLISESLNNLVTPHTVAEVLKKAERKGKVRRTTTKGGMTVRVELLEPITPAVPIEEPLDPDVFRGKPQNAPERLQEAPKPSYAHQDASATLQMVLDAVEAHVKASMPEADPVTMEMCERLSDGHDRALESLRKIAQDPRNVFDYVDAAIAALEETAL